MDQIINPLNKIDWNFSDYNSLHFPADINSLHWYPAAFVPQIPSILINVLSKPNDKILDPFAGSGITLIEAARLMRHYIGIDSNQYAINIARAKLQAIEETNDQWFSSEMKNIRSIVPINPGKYCESAGINPEVFKWFENNTLSELFAIHNFIVKNKSTPGSLVRQVIFSSILNKCCSQREHYTYITDNCFPSLMINRPAKQIFLEQLNLINGAIKTSKLQFQKIYNIEWEPSKYGTFELGDARDLKCIKNNEIDLVVTSPPYLGVNDYTRSMRLTYLFFPETDIDHAISVEIGARRKRHRKFALEEYLSDMKAVFAEIARVLKPCSNLCLVLGQGRGKVNKTKNIIENLLNILQSEYKFHLLFNQERKIKFRRIQVPGVSKEIIIVLGRN